MVTYKVYVEIEGVQTEVGIIEGQDYYDARFLYSQSYMIRPNAKPISISLPFQNDYFSASQTKSFFDGLLPEGFTRRAVSEWLNFDDRDYLSILYSLGRECIGAIQIAKDNENLPERYVEINKKKIKELASEGTSKSTELVTKAHLSLTGASGKVGLYFDKINQKWYLPEGLAPSTHIVKQSHIRYQNIVTNEQLTLLTAKECGIDIPDSFIINVGNGKDSEVLFATERFDRLFNEKSSVIDGLRKPFRLHQEDFSQAMGISSTNKYEPEGANYLREMFEIIRKYSSNPLEDQIKLWDRIVFNYLTGNTDAHIKNYSLLYGYDMQSIRLAPAYDMLSTVIYEGTSNEMSFGIGKEKNLKKINRESFAISASEIGITEKTALKHFDNMCNKFESALRKSADQLTDTGFQNAKIISEKILKNRSWR
ncbi:MAG: HipA domain-containing protein [Lachnospiraceae bacterium]|nr:HipA domain-containing protein [Lachnospiraceae bacterium]